MITNRSPFHAKLKIMFKRNRTPNVGLQLSEYEQAKAYLKERFGDDFDDPDRDLMPYNSYAIGSLKPDLPGFRSEAEADRFYEVAREVVARAIADPAFRAGLPPWHQNH